MRARLRYAQERGDGAIQRLLAEMSPELRALCDAGFLVNGWYPFSAFIELTTLLDRLWGRGDYELCYEIGRYACDVNLPTLYRIFFRIGSVPFIVRRAAAAWRVNYDEGELLVVEQTDESARLHIRGVPQPHRAHCQSVRGWIVRAAEISGGEVTEQSERCRTLGDPECELFFRWRKRRPQAPAK